MSETAQKIVMYSTTWCKDCHFAKRWLDSHHIAYEEIDVEQNEQAAEYVRQVNNGRRTVPTIIFPDGSVLVEPDGHQLAAKFPELA